MQIHGDALRFGVHSGQMYESFDQCLELWQRAEALGYDWVSDFDHFRPPAGGPNGPCFEGTTLLSALSARTTRVRCGVLVLAIPYRHPAIVASIAATIDHVSSGRVELGLGAGGDDLGFDQYGIPFQNAGVRLEMLDEACRIIRSLLTQEKTTFEGKHYRVKDACLAPKPLQQRLPFVIGGSGERRMLRIVAEHADVWNTLAGDLAAYQRRLASLSAHCAEIGRDPADIRKSVLFRAVLADSEREAKERLRELVGDVPPDSPALKGWLTVGTAEQCVEALRPYVDRGAADLLLGVRPPIDWGTLELVARKVAPALRG
jgi:alkanesulfonate monooxygenase SsuD/methylene tetrahydromethanopterin reductase-like flavin-dependent oxidoreductase (luciferase family)